MIPLAGLTEAQRLGISESEFKRRLFSDSEDILFQRPRHYEQQSSGDAVPAPVGVLLPNPESDARVQILSQAEIQI